jgi:hypothetical protein
MQFDVRVQIRLSRARNATDSTDERLLSRMSIHVFRCSVAIPIREFLHVLLQIRAIAPLTSIRAFATANMSLHVIVEILLVLELLITLSPFTSKQLKEGEPIQVFYS